MAKNLREFKFTKYYGMNNTKSPIELGSFEAENIENWLIRYQGKLVRRNGLTLLGNDTGSNKVLGLTHYISGATKAQIRVVTTQLEVLSAGTWSAMSGAGATGLTTGLDMNFCFANGYLYGFNGTDTVRKANNTTVTTVAGIPVGKFAVWFRNYMFVGGVAAYPNRIYFSNLGDPETFSADDYIDVEPGDGDELTGLISNSPDKLTITKKYSVHYLTGAGTNTFAVYVVTRDFGIASHRSLVPVGQDVWGINSEGRIVSIYRNQYGLLSGKDMSSEFIEETINGLNMSGLNKVCAATLDGYILFAVPVGASTYNNLVLVYDVDAPVPASMSKWVTFTGWSPSVFDVYSPAGIDILYMGEGQADSKCYSWAGNTDNGTVITATWEGPEMEFESEGSLKRHRQIKIWGEALGNFDLSVYASLDNATYTDIGNLNLSATGGTWNTSVWGSFLWGAIGSVTERLHFSTNGGAVKGFKAQLKFIYNANSGSPSILSHSIYYTPLRWR